MSVRLSILDQSPIISRRKRRREALHATLELAQGGRSPGLSPLLAGRTSRHERSRRPLPGDPARPGRAHAPRIRIGTGGVLLPYYSPLKVAEVFRMHEALYPGRIDLGIGRAPGGDLLTAKAMNADAFADEEFPTQVQEVVGYLDDARCPTSIRITTVQAMPAGPSSPEVWLLGSSDYSGALAAYLGLRFAFAHFINAQGGDAVTRAYRDGFRPRSANGGPTRMVCVFAICAPTQAEAERLAAQHRPAPLQMTHGVDAPIATGRGSAGVSIQRRDRAIIERERARAVIGTPDKVKARLLELQEQLPRGRVDDHHHHRATTPAGCAPMNCWRRLSNSMPISVCRRTHNTVASIPTRRPSR